MIQKLIHPESRAIALVKPYLRGDSAYRGFVPAPWDCVCVAKCNCNLRPTRPTADQLEEAKASLERLAIGIAETEAELGIGQDTEEPGTGRSKKKGNQ